MPHEDLSYLKVKLKDTCDKYSQIYVQYKYKKIIEQLSNNCIMRQEKGRGVVIIDKSKYMFRITTNKPVFKTSMIRPIRLKIKSNFHLKIENKIVNTAILSVVSNRLIPRKILWYCKITN